MKKLFFRLSLLASLIGLGAAGSLPSPNYATVNLGIAGSVNGTVVFNNATSGSITLSAPTGALGTVTDTLPLGGTLLSSTSSVPYSQLPALSANQVLGALTATTPSGQSVPSCSATSDALIWTSGNGFGCVTGYAPLASPNFTATPTAPTAAVATNNTQIATTAYVENSFAAPPAVGNTTANTGAFTLLSASSTVSGAGFTSLLSPYAKTSQLGAFSAYFFIGSDTTLTNAYVNNFIQVSGNYTITLPAAYTCPPGSTLTFYPNGYPYTIITQGSDIMYPGSGTGSLTSITITPGGSIILVSRGNTEWDIIGGSALLNYQTVPIGSYLPSTGAFTSLSASSFIKFPQYTVSTLPTCNAAAKGEMASVTDATSPTYNGTLTGGGSVDVPVFCNGSAWVSN